MHLKRLEIYGFKSFADRVCIEFDKGITAIVGPNGSGKSNIADAIRWVLGEQSAKSLRGGKMEDVIFSGAQTRKPLGFAEVTLVLDNSDGTLPTEYSEVSITRRVFRSGESEYYINRTPCRLKDVVELFVDTGIGKEGYSIIGQGRVEELLSMHVEERRGIFEEAAGIMKYKLRKEEAQKKLEKTEENITRIEDILAELGQQLKPLEAQSKVAQQYLNLRERLKLLEVNRFIQQYDRYVSRLREIDDEIHLLEGDISFHRQHVERLEKERLRLQQELEGKQKEAEQLVKRRYALAQEMEKVKGRIQLLEQRISQYQKDNERFEKEIQEEGLYVNRSVSERNACIEQLANLERAVEEKKGHIERLALELAHINEELLSKQRELDARRGAAAQVLDRLAECKNSITRYRTLKENLEEKYSNTERLIRSRLEQKEALLESQRRTRESLSSIISESQGVLQRREEVKRILNDLKVEMAERRNLLQIKRQNLEGMRSRFALLKDMDEAYEGFSKSVRKVFEVCKRDQALAERLCGVVADLIEVPQEYELAIETALGGSLQHIVTETEEDAQYIIEFLRENGYGRATFLPLTSIQPRTLNEHEMDALELDGCIGIASELVKFDPKYSKVIEYLLGRVVVARTLNQAIAMARKYSYSFRIVTLEGDVLHPGGSITGGSSGTAKSTGILSRKREIAELKEAIFQQERGIADEQDRLRALEQRYAQLERQLDQLNKEAHSLELAKAAQEERLHHATAQLLKLEEEVRRLEEEQKGLESELKRVEASIEGGLKEISQLEKESAGVRCAIEAIESSFKSLGESKEELEKRIADLRLDLTTLELSAENLKQRISQLEADITQRQEGIAKKRDLMEDNRQQIRRCLDEIEQHSGALESLKEEAEQLSDVLKGMEGEREGLLKRLEELQSEIKRLSGTIEEIVDKKHRFEVQRSRLEAELENLQNNMWNEYGVTYNSALAYLDKGLKLNNINQEIQNIKESIQVLGQVNVSAIDEYKRIKERFEFLESQRRDLVEAKRNLSNVIQDVTRVMEERFRQEFELINHEFQQVFSRLFGGGVARLVLENEDDVLGCGIDIVAQPPGKKLQSLSLLSGGEKALTAIAMLFAILKRKPTPFCVLDEIDTALDEANLANLGRFIKEFSRHTQFIIITHRRPTMEVADALYGIAMEEKGVSKLVSVRLDKAS
ncbi:chromosome segregation protein [Caldicoprobacter guelmensis]|uniref:chromosome segregation protein SMC n=1 Tax=Caldicoprobacter guelmensis TaxID=1170224 RepID=UPI00195B1359|nr:chromosome segregation protein SMC [Caldicoprobacter guelmensis]MBM7581230.1 chromosome segregation protein [Caldicoprobacter guelmensis]